MKRLVILSILAAIITASCKKDIHLNLHNAAGLVVIEGNINNQPGPYYVGISRTVTFYDSNNVVPVTTASLVMTDDAGNIDTLKPSGWPGLYQTTTIVGTVGRTYHLSVNVDGKQYDATSTMPPPITIDSIGAQPFAFRGKEYWAVYGLFSDAPGISNYCKAWLYVNGKKQSTVIPISDQFSPGLTIQTYVNPDFFSNAGDTIQMNIDAIDKPIYDYFYTLQQSTLSQNSAAPANPISNFSNNALGYFCASSPALSHHIVLDITGYHRID